MSRTSWVNSALRMVLFYPHVLSALVVGFRWGAILGTNGAVNSYLTSHGADVLPFLSDPDWATVTLIAVLVWAGFGVNTRMEYDKIGVKADFPYPRPPATVPTTH